MRKQSFNEKLIALLKTDPKFVDETGEFIPSRCIGIKQRWWKSKIHHL